MTPWRDRLGMFAIGFFVAFVLLPLAGCGDLPPADFVIDGVRYTLPAEKNVPRETAVRPGVEVIVYGNTSWGEMQALNCAGAGLDAGCSLLLGGMCLVWLLDPGVIPAAIRARIDRHERRGHCNGHVHTVYQTEAGWVLDWQAGPR